MRAISATRVALHLPRCRAAHRDRHSSIRRAAVAEPSSALHRFVVCCRFFHPRNSMKRLLFALCGAALIANAPAFAQSTHPSVLFKTSDGDIRVELYPEKAPKTVANFLDYVKAGQYNGTIFHRVIPGFMIQGGGYTTSFTEKPTRAPIPLESRNGLKNTSGALAMARTSDPNSATAQFFINTVDNANLDYPNPDGNGYAVFGKVTSGMDVVKKIEATPTTTRGPMSDVPQQPIVIQSATVVGK
jgi:peptidyl-prolyl cis-trans isomerase A (cyclophilin A)